MIYLVVIGAIIFLGVYVSALVKRRRLERYLRRTWGNAMPPREMSGDMMLDIATYWRTRQKENPSAHFVDDITWSDLDMDDIFQWLNRTESGVGEEVLYAMLRSTDADAQILARREEYARFIEKNPAQRLQVRAALCRLGRTRYHGAAEYLFHPSGKMPQNRALYSILAALPLIFLALSFWNTGFFLGIAISFAVNLVVFYISGKTWMREIASIRHIAAVLSVANRIRRARIAGLDELSAELDKICTEMKPVLRWNALFAMQRQSDMDIITEYLRILFQLDMLSLIKLTEFFCKHNETLRKLYRVVGELDACVAVANLRAAGGVYCAPEFTEKMCLSARGLAHPLVRKPVRNDFLWDMSVLITGSNASGKSTFTKAVAINAVLAQSVGLCTAESFSMPRAGVLSSMALRDDVMGGESYFIVEIKSLRRILRALESGEPCLLFIDEILRGTNTVERIAASTALLQNIAEKHCLCMAATHDQELTRLLPRYRKVHFREELTGRGMTFSYKIMDGPSDTRNAIALLKQMDFPDEVVQSAQNAVGYYEKNARWPFQEGISQT